MSRIALIACTKTKAAQAAPAALLYQSPLFRKSLLYALGTADRIYILSAKHGVLQIDEVVDPYELSMKDLTASQKLIWTAKVSERLAKLLAPSDKVQLLAGLEYTRPLLPLFHRIGCRITFPLGGKSLGPRLSLLGRMNSEVDLHTQFSRFYASMRELYIGQNGGRVLAECTGKMEWPLRGVYFLFEPGEHLSTSRFRPLTERVVRVGTHGVSRGSKATLWNRISTHRGVIAGAGNHRSSIFRLHVGAALMRNQPTMWNAPNWGVGQIAAAEIQQDEISLERQVSLTLGRMKLLWLNVPDNPSPYSDRSYLERNSIGLLSRAAILHGGQSSTWLGNLSKQIHISLSGLWNLDHLYRIPDPAFPDVLAKYVAITLGKIEPPSQSIAPVAWYRKTEPSDSQQLSLFTDDTGTPAAHRH
jgi:hypothetical protein